MTMFGWTEDEELERIKQETGEATLEWVNEKIGVIDNELRDMEQLVVYAESRMALVASAYMALRERKIKLDTPENILDHDLDGWDRVDERSWTWDDGEGRVFHVQLVEQEQVKLTINAEGHFRGIIEFSNIQDAVEWLEWYANESPGVTVEEPPEEL